MPPPIWDAEGWTNGRWWAGTGTVTVSSMRAHPTAEVGRLVPFLDIAPMHSPLHETLLREISDLFESGAFTNGAAVASFETAFSAYCGAAHCIGVASGLDALRLGLLANGLEPGGEVVVPAATFVATLEAVTQAGGRPVVVDVSESDYCLDPAAAAAAIGSPTHSLLPVHLYGQMAEMDALLKLASDQGIRVIEDACQAHGAMRGGLHAGAAGTAAAFSFYPGKNLGAAGDAGALVTSDAAVAKHVCALRDHGQTAKYVHAYEGWTSRLDTIQALVLLRKLPLLDGWNEQRAAAAAFYGEALADVGDLVLPAAAHESRPVWHLYVIRTGEPERLAVSLRERGIGTGRHYPFPVHLTEAYAWLGYRRGQFPVAEKLAHECLSLPMFPGISEDQLALVVEGIRAYFDG
jgi:dTDP-4-amino-4,6-dideoxygalactose transaminase